jgi:hypothetical protein
MTCVGELAQIPSQDTMVPLARALELISEGVHAHGPTGLPVLSTELFDGLACTVSVLAPMFVLDSRDGPRRLSEEVLAKALFRKNGTEIYFVDGRAPIGNLAVTAEGIANVVRILRGAEPD